MGLNIKNEEVERLAEEVARLSGETKTEAVRRALEERRARLTLRVAESGREARLLRFLDSEVWPRVPESELGRSRPREEEDELLGYGSDGL